jgi:hypothetical protein
LRCHAGHSDCHAIYVLDLSSTIRTLTYTLYMSYWPARLLRTNVPSAHPVHSEHWPTLSICHTGQPDCYEQMCPRPIQFIRNTGPHSLYVILAGLTVMDKCALGPSSAFGTLAHTLYMSHQPARLLWTYMPSAHSVHSEYWPTLSQCHTHQLTVTDKCALGPSSTCRTYIHNIMAHCL